MSTTPLRVLLLTWDFPPARGGIQTWMYQLACRLPDASVRVVTVTAAEPFEGDARIKVSRLASSKLGLIPWLVHTSIVVLLKSLLDRPDIIVCGHVVTVPAALLPRWFGTPVVTFAYAWEIRRRPGRAVRFLLKASSLVIAISRFSEQAVAARGIDPSRIRVLYPGVDPQQFGGSGANVPRGSAKNILTVSRLNERYKGHDMVIRALPLVRAVCGDVEYIVVGDGSLRPFLVELAASVGVASAVTFTGEVDDAELARLIQSCDALVQMSRGSIDGGSEGFGIACLEAGAAGKPVIAGRSGGLMDAVEGGASGLLVNPEDLGEITDAIVSVLSDPGLAARLGQGGRARVQRAFTWDQMARNARRLLGEAAGKPEPEPCASST